MTVDRDPRAPRLVVTGKQPTSATRDAQARDIMRESGDLHRLLVESVRDYAIFALDPQGYILSWNAGAQQFKGYTEEEAIGQHFSIFYPAEMIARHHPEHELEVAAREGHFEEEGWRLRKDGTRFWASVVITALRDPEGTLVGFAKVTRDLTARQMALTALRESEQRFRLLVQGVRDYAIFMLEPDGVVATWNEGAHRIKGYTADEIIGRHMSVFYPPEDVASGKVARELEIATREGSFEEEGERVRKDGTRFWANVLITAIRDEHGKLIGFGKVTRDLTERRAAQLKELEDARRLASEEGARQAAEERAKEMHTLATRLSEQAAELRERSVEAEKANKAKSGFLAAMSHELRTPLNAIGGYTELLALGIDGPVTPQQVEHLGRIKVSQQHLLRVIGDILNFSSVEAGRITYEIKRVPMNEVTETVAQMIERQAESRRVAFVHDTCTGAFVVRGDRAKIQQVLLNLLSNALKFTPAGGTVTLACRVEGSELLVQVQDTGVGIAPENLETVFEPFVQVGRSLTSDHEGTGLGLAISRELARGMNGDVKVESTIDAGSTFTLHLPLALDAQPSR
jgi:PAS domain S-box-containing protein